jgi:hypothetical protein
MPKSEPVLLDLNNPIFQDQLFSLAADDVVDVLNALKKLRKIDWQTLHKHKGFHWEDAGHIGAAPNGSRIKSIRITQKARALAYREGNFMRFLSLHLDHDSAYR